jgi:Homeodomain-like domain
MAKGPANARQLAQARVLLPVDETEAAPGRSDEETASALQLSVRTVARVWERFVEQGFAAALLPAPSKRVYARTFAGASQARLIALACGAPPAGQARWTLRLLAEQLLELPVLDTVSRQCVRQALKKTNSNRI